MDEFRADVRKKLEEAAQKTKLRLKPKMQLSTRLLKMPSSIFPDAMVETQIDNSVRDFAQRLSYQGMNPDMYMQYTRYDNGRSKSSIR